MTECSRNKQRDKEGPRDNARTSQIPKTQENSQQYSSHLKTTHQYSKKQHKKLMAMQSPRPTKTQRLQRCNEQKIKAPSKAYINHRKR